MEALDEKVTWREWKYLFKLATAKVAWLLSKARQHQTTLDPLIIKASDMVPRDEFKHSLVTLGLLGVNPASGVPTDSPQSETQQSTNKAQGPSKALAATTTKYAQLHCVESLCKPPYARDSSLASQALTLLHAHSNTDMMFHIIPVQDSAGDVVVDHLTAGEGSLEAPVAEAEAHKVPAHCVILSARCDWFKRALTSGMKESIQKKMTIHDTSVDMFKLFLSYLYSGHVDTAQLNTEQLSDMMALADRYEVCSLASTCESSLLTHIDDNSALFLLNLADQYNALSLRSAALNFITEHPDMLESEVFEDLPEHLQIEVEEAISFDSPIGNSNLGCVGAAGFGVQYTPGADFHMETPGSDMEDLMTALDLADRVSGSDSSSSTPSMGMMEDSGRVDACVASLRAIIGSEIPQQELVDIALAADCDTNRALNFFFAS